MLSKVFCSAETPQISQTEKKADGGKTQKIAMRTLKGLRGQPTQISWNDRMLSALMSIDS